MWNCRQERDFYLILDPWITLIRFDKSRASAPPSQKASNVVLWSFLWCYLNKLLNKQSSDIGFSLWLSLPIPHWPASQPSYPGPLANFHTPGTTCCANSQYIWKGNFSQGRPGPISYTSSCLSPTSPTWKVHIPNNIQGLYSLSGKTPYWKISWSLEAARFRFKLFQSLWNLAGTLAALLPRCLSNCRAIQPLQHPISRLRDFTRFGGKTSYRLVNRGPDMRG